MLNLSIKRIFIYSVTILLLVLFNFKVEAKSGNEGLEWLDWNKAQELAKTDKDKIIFIDVYTDWCGWCKKMDKDTYENEEIIKMIRKKFLAVKLNPEKDAKYKVDDMEVSGSQLLNMLTNNQQMGYPTILFIIPKTRVVYPMAGYQNAVDFKATLEKIVVNSKGK